MGLHPVASGNGNGMLNLVNAPGAGRLVWWLCGFWGLVVLLPVGVNYLALLLLLLAVLVQGDRAQRLARLRAHPMWWPLVLYVLWTLVVLALQPTIFEETPSNLWHGGRIVLTLALAISLSQEEARMALLGFLASLGLGVLVIAAYHAGITPDWGFWAHLTHPSTNKTISAAILFSMLATAALVVTSSSLGGRMRWLSACVLMVALLVMVVALGKRTAMVGFFLAVLAAGVHQWRHHRLRLASAMSLTTFAAALLIVSVPGVESRLMQGVSEVQAAMSGAVDPTSWGVRVQMIRHTSDMMIERPLTGWGIGAWNDQWRARVPAELAGFNMPHNDLLWMGAQGGVPGALLWLLLLVSAGWAAWTRRNWQGRAAFVVVVITTASALVNNATRDATIGLPMLWMMGVFLSLAATSEVSHD
jgi:O-antigen ligase